jgi:hypothetical protein
MIVSLIPDFIQATKRWGIILPRESLEGADLNRAITLALQVGMAKSWFLGCHVG